MTGEMEDVGIGRDGVLEGLNRGVCEVFGPDGGDHREGLLYLLLLGVELQAWVFGADGVGEEGHEAEGPPADRVERARRFGQHVVTHDGNLPVEGEEAFDALLTGGSAGPGNVSVLPGDIGLLVVCQYTE